MYFLFQLKHKEQVEGEQNRGDNTSSFTGCTILNADHGNDDKYSYKLGDISRFQFRTKRTYLYSTGQIVEFVVGRNTFSIRLPVNILSLGLTGELIGTSILSFKEKGSVLAHRPGEGNKNIHWLQDRIPSDGEGRYWLWFILNQDYILIDSKTFISEFSDGKALQRFDLGKYGKY